MQSYWVKTFLRLLSLLGMKNEHMWDSLDWNWTRLPVNLSPEKLFPGPQRILLNIGSAERVRWLRVLFSEFVFNPRCRRKPIFMTLDLGDSWSLGNWELTGRLAHWVAFWIENNNNNTDHNKLNCPHLCCNLHRPFNREERVCGRGIEQKWQNGEKHHLEKFDYI